MLDFTSYTTCPECLELAAGDYCENCHVCECGERYTIDGRPVTWNVWGPLNCAACTPEDEFLQVCVSGRLHVYACDEACEA